MDKEEFMYWLRGAVRSWTVWFGVLLAATPDIVALIEPELRPLVGDVVWTWISLSAKVIGVCIVALRVRTTVPLTVKGGKPGEIAE